MASLRRCLVAALALGSASALQFPSQLPLGPLAGLKLAWNSGEAADAGPTPKGLPVIDSEALQAAITSKNLQTRAYALYDIAKTSEEDYGNPTRVIGSKGHAATLAYIAEELASLGDYYNVSSQDFPAVTGYIFEYRLVIGNEVPGSTYPMGLTPPTPSKEPVYGDLVLADNDGCHESDYSENIKGAVALIRRGTCSFGDKSLVAGKAGAVAAVIFNNEDGTVRGTLGNPSPDHIATFGMSGEEGAHISQRLEAGERIDAIAYMDAEVNVIGTSNIVAQTTGGDPENCVMVGSHTDSVAAGPGINDDGSGSLSILEVARQLSEFSVNNCVRFAWWSGEEEGLLGSDYYVAELPAEENKKIRLFMDYDMMASPNYAYQIYDANNEANPNGSAELKKLYSDWYEEHGLNYTYIPFDGRSDYDAFIRNGIPGGGIATGAEGIKSIAEAEMFGGTAGNWYDPCYHQLCDDIANVDLTAWEYNTKLIAHSVATYALSLEGFPKRTDFAAAQADAYAQNVKYHGHERLVANRVATLSS